MKGVSRNMTQNGLNDVLQLRVVFGFLFSASYAIIVQKIRVYQPHYAPETVYTNDDEIYIQK